MKKTRLLALLPFWLLLSVGLALSAGGPALGRSPVAPPGTARSSVPPLRPDLAEQFAQRLALAAQTIANRYIEDRSVPRLLAAAARALYAATDTVAPEGLDAEWEKFAEPEQGVRALAQVRLALGKHPRLRDGNDLRIALEGMLGDLDPHCTLAVTSDLAYRTVIATSPIGLTFEDRADPEQPWVIQGLAPRGAADRAGLKPGDQLVTVDGAAPPKRTSAAAFIASLGGRVNQSRKFQVLSPGAANSREVAIRYQVEGPAPFCIYGVNRREEGSWNFWLDERRHLAYVRLGAIEQGIAETLGDELRQLRQEGMTALILDLRDCPMGFLIEAVDTASLFLERKDGLVARTREGPPDRSNEPAAADAPRPADAPRGRDLPPANLPQRLPPLQMPQFDRNTYVVRFDGPVARNIPLVVLIGPETSGAGELIAAALQDHRRAVLVGERTRGKASTQNEISELDLPVFRLTVGLIYRPNGKTYQRFPHNEATGDYGIHPDSGWEVRVPRPLQRQVRRWRHDYERRPQDSRQLQPLDYVENDPVLARALKYFEPKGKPQM